MAGTATATYSADVWTSASSVDGGQQPWEFSVPVNHDGNSSNNNSRQRSKSRTSRDAKSRDRGSKGSRSSSMSRHAYDRSHYATRGRPDASISREEVETKAAQDGGSTHINGSAKKGDVKDGIGIKPGDLNDENWIHRDKLARIESEELQQAAILFQRRPGTGSTRAGRGRSRDQQKGSISGTTATTPAPTEPLEPWPDFQEDQQIQLKQEKQETRTTSLVLDDDNGDDTRDEERQHWDLRRPEEIAAELEYSASYMYRNPGLRKSSSRIPIPTASPAPLSPDQIDREFFLPRSRAPTNEEEESPSIAMPRRASEPITVDSASTSSPPSDSRPGSRGVQTSQNANKKNPAKASPTNRKASAPLPKKTTTPRSRAPSSHNTQRPTTRSGEIRPPTAVNRPEGDPPWLATMYKPDPRLPPDQQILPTHARRMQQEQWAKEGKTPTTYDREFAPLAIASDPLPVQNKVEKETEKPQEPEPPKPEGLGLHSLPKSPEPGTRPGTSTGYSPMPKLQDTPPTGLTPRFNSQTVVTAQGPPPQEKEPKGCGCCIVM